MIESVLPAMKLDRNSVLETGLDHEIDENLAISEIEDQKSTDLKGSSYSISPTTLTKLLSKVQYALPVKVQTSIQTQDIITSTQKNDRYAIEAISTSKYDMTSFEPVDHDERINTRFATQAIRLLHMSIEEDQRARSRSDVRFSRDLYMDAMEYFLRGIPSLSEEERQNFQVALTRHNLLPPPEKNDTGLSIEDGLTPMQRIIIRTCRNGAFVARRAAPRIKTLVESCVDVAVNTEQRLHLVQKGWNVACSVKVPKFAEQFMTACLIGVFEGGRVLFDDTSDKA